MTLENILTGFQLLDDLGNVTRQELAGLGLRDMSIGQPSHDDALLPAERPADQQFVAGAEQAIRLRRLTVDVDLSTLAGVLSFGPRPEQARDVQPDVEADVLDYAQIRSLRVSSSAKLMAQIMITQPRKIITSVVSAAVSRDLAPRPLLVRHVTALARTK